MGDFMDSVKMAMLICLLYGYIRIIVEFFSVGVSDGTIYIALLIIGAHALWLIRNKQIATGRFQDSVQSSLLLFFASIICIAMAMDAGRMLLS